MITTYYYNANTQAGREVERDTNDKSARPPSLILIVLALFNYFKLEWTHTAKERSGLIVSAPAVRALAHPVAWVQLLPLRVFFWPLCMLVCVSVFVLRK